MTDESDTVIKKDVKAELEETQGPAADNAETSLGNIKTEIATDNRDPMLGTPIASDFSADQLAAALKEVIVPANIKDMTKRSAREALEKKLGLECGGLTSRKAEVNGLIENLVAEYMKSQGEVHDERNEPSTPDPQRKESDNENESNRSKKRAAPSTSRGDSDDNQSQEDDESESSEEEDGRKRKGSKKAVPKKKLKQAQSKMMTRAAFTENARIMDVKMGPSLSFQMSPREFSTGSMGWFYGSKVQILVGEQPVHCQLTVNCAVLGSKEWKNGKRTK